MVNIQPVSIWKDGADKQASVLVARIINDDMSSSAQFYYELKQADSTDEDGNVIAGASLRDGNVSMSGQNYEDWDDSNAAAYQFIADALNLVIV